MRDNPAQTARDDQTIAAVAEKFKNATPGERLAMQGETMAGVIVLFLCEIPLTSKEEGGTAKFELRKRIRGAVREFRDSNPEVNNLAILNQAAQIIVEQYQLEAEFEPALEPEARFVAKIPSFLDNHPELVNEDFATDVLIQVDLT